MTLPEAQRVTGHDGYDSISISTGGEDPDTVKAAIAKTLGRDFLVRTGKEAAEQQAQDLSDALGFIRIALLIFAGVALLVGGFLIFNTFTVTVAQRTKEFALLRVLGASRGQVLRSVLIETFAVGLFASILGVLAGLVVAPALAALMRAGGIDLGTTGIVVAPTTVIIGLVIGLVATMVSGFVPALRATRVEPVTAMRDAVTPGLKHMGTLRIVGSGLLVAAGLAVLFIGLFGGLDSGSAAASLIGLGARADDVRVRVPGAAAGAAAGARARRADGALPGPDGRARARERDPPAAAHGGHGRGADGRPRARGARRGVRRRAEGHDQRDGRRPGAARRSSSRTRTASARSRPTSSRPCRTVPGVTDVASMRFAVGQVKGDSGTTAVNGIDPKTFNSVLTLKWVEGDPDTLSRLTDEQVDRRDRLGLLARRRRRRHRRVHDAGRQAGRPTRSPARSRTRPA